MRSPTVSFRTRYLLGVILVSGMVSTGCNPTSNYFESGTHFNDGYPEHTPPRGSNKSLQGEFVSRRLVEQRAREEKFLKALVRGNYVMILIDDLPKGGIDFVQEEINTYPEKKLGQRTAWGTKTDKARMTLYGTNNVQEIANRIKFGKVTEVDLKKNKIYVKFDSSQLPDDWKIAHLIKNSGYGLSSSNKELQKLETSAKNQTDPKFCEANLTFLEYGNSRQQQQALERLAQFDPQNLEDDELWQKIVEKIMTAVRNDDLGNSDVQARAIYAMIPWCPDESGPALAELLDRNNTPFIRKNVYQAVAELGDPRTFDSVANQFANNFVDQGDALKCLLILGTPAEESVLRHADLEAHFIKEELVEVLGKIGSEKSLPALKTLWDKAPFPSDKEKIEAAAAAIRSRSGASSE